MGLATEAEEVQEVGEADSAIEDAVVAEVGVELEMVL